MSQQISISKVRIDGGTQAREKLNKEVVEDYAERMREDKTFPPVTLYYDGTDYWLVDGFHRLEAAKTAGREEIDAEVKEGSKRDAILAACGANADHGLRRTNEDKKRAVVMMLQDPEWSQWSDRRIADHCHVSNDMVSRYRKELSSDDSGGTVRIGKGGRKIDTAKIGKTKSKKPELKLVVPEAEEPNELPAEGQSEAAATATPPDPALPAVAQEAADNASSPEQDEEPADGGADVPDVFDDPAGPPQSVEPVRVVPDLPSSWAMSTPEARRGFLRLYRLTPGKHKGGKTYLAFPEEVRRLLDATPLRYDDRLAVAFRRHAEEAGGGDNVWRLAANRASRGEPATTPDDVARLFGPEPSEHPIQAVVRHLIRSFGQDVVLEQFVGFQGADAGPAEMTPPVASGNGEPGDPDGDAR